MAEPSIAMIPSGYKAEKIYSVLPTNGNADLDFSRNSKATRINEQGLIEEMAVNVPILDYSDGTCPSLKLQPQSTNLITYSEAFGNSYWTKSGATVTSGFSAPSVDSPLGAFKLVEDSGNSKHQILASISSYTELTISFFAKKAERSFISVEKSSWGSTIFDLNDGSVVSGNGSVIDLGNGWYRCSASYTASVSQTQFYILLLEDGSSSNYQGDGVSGVYIYGMQAEVQSYATSYIKTEGSTQTRLQDTASKSGISSLINSSEGVLYAEISALYDNSVNDLRWFSLNDNSTNNLVTIYYYKATNTIGAQLKVGGVQVFRNDDIPITSKTDFIKIAFKWKQDDVAIYINGIKKASSTSVNSFNSGVLNRFSFDRGVGGQDFYGKTKNLQVYKTALTDAQLTTLTTI